MTGERICEDCGAEVASQTGKRPSSCPQCGGDLVRPSTDDDLTAAERERIEDDPVLTIEDVRDRDDDDDDSAGAAVVMPDGGQHEQLERVDEWDSHGNPYWNGVARSGSHAPGTGKLHRARIEDGRVVEVECHANAETWVPFSADSVPQPDREGCYRCGALTKVPGVERADRLSRVRLTEDYDPAQWAPEPATDGGRVEIPFNDWSCERLAEREKTATTRTSRYGDPGDEFVVDGTVYELTHVVHVPLRVVADHFYGVEGCDSRAEFIDVWEDIHYRRGFEPEWPVYLHLFREVDR
jgi:hypothetical protein